MNKYPRTPQIHPLSQEPWVKLADGDDLKEWSREDEIEYNQANRQTHKLAFFSQVFDFIMVGIDLLSRTMSALGFPLKNPTVHLFRKGPLVFPVFFRVGGINLS